MTREEIKEVVAEVMPILLSKLKDMVAENTHVYDYLEIKSSNVTLSKMHELGQQGWKYCFNSSDIHTKDLQQDSMIFQRGKVGVRKEEPAIKDLEDI